MNAIGRETCCGVGSAPSCSSRPGVARIPPRPLGANSPSFSLRSKRRTISPASAASVANDVRPKMNDEAWEQLELETGFCNIASGYSAEMIKQRVLDKPGDAVGVVCRAFTMVATLGSYYIGLQSDNLAGISETPDRIQYRAAQLREILTDLGPSFIKAGQVLANRPDIMRQDFMNELCTLQDDVPSFPDEQAMEIIESDLGRPLEEVFSYISETPVAAASLGQVYKATLRSTGEEVAVKVQRPGVEPTIYRDLYLFRTLGTLFDKVAMERLGCSAQLIVDEFGEKLLEELNYEQEARNIQEFGKNFENDPLVKIPWVREDLSGPRVLTMEWIDGIRCTDPDAVRRALDEDEFIRCGVRSGLRQLLEFGLFHGDPHPGNIFAMRDGRIAYVDFGNVAQLSQYNKQILVDAVVHAVNEDYVEMANDFIKLGFLANGTDTTPIVPALEKIWKDSMGQTMAVFNFRTVTTKFNELVYQYPIRIPERFSLVIRSLLTQEGICLNLDPEFHFLEVAYPYVARRLLTDEDPALRDRLIQVLFQDGKFRWKRLENLITLAREGMGGNLVLNDTLKDGIRLLLLDDRLRDQLVLAFTEDNRLHVEEVASLLDLVRDDIDPQQLLSDAVSDIPLFSRKLMMDWSDRVLAA
ncbi:hypothetical protein BSKO_09911 [Bryopsis sp. KO-2023]|nr:hypothetical protein BSKO_09911 [Bryopsis sp. KO-2023]